MRDNWGRESVKGRWCGAHRVESEVRGRVRSSPGDPPAYPALGQAGELEGPGNRLGTTSCRAPETSPRPPTGGAPGLRQWWTAPLSLSLRPTSSGRLSGSQFVRSGLPIWAAWGDWRPPGKDAWLSGMTAGQDVGTWPEGAANRSASS